MNSLHIFDIFILICNEIKINKLPKLELISKHHNNIIKKYEWINNTLLIVNELILQYILQNYNFRNLQIIFDCNKYICELQNCHTLIIDQFIDHNNVPLLRKCHTVHFICSFPPFLPSEKLYKLKYCHTIRTYSAVITDKCLKKLRKCHKLEFIHPQLFFENTYGSIQNEHNISITNACFSTPFVSDKGVTYLRKCHTLHLNVPFVNNKCIEKLKNCHTLYLNSWHVSNKTIKKLKNCHKIYLFTQYETNEHIIKLNNPNVEHYGSTY